ncbi:MFS general substrate transporter [Guyanagaster necrorhizus]|uniref:MFS general substrate transporter n=1 Tax=Guyanagaster necrorhizus TaxID=856835 RepID=A0A9P7VS91_9AGAR|nr:MFS general substrate transporter [Guyanagaster necrorhizus MCA 3950]KAG7446491.1 MFS general substrate transporter [Guyanagaster necrorhizus MCA 3950]
MFVRASPLLLSDLIMESDASTISCAAKVKDAVDIDVKNVNTLSAIPESEREAAIDTVAAAEQYTEEEYKSLVRKIDLVLLPLMWVLYGLQQADKTGISTQATFNMWSDLGMKGQDYALLTTIFYVSYLVFETPGNYIMQRINIGKMLGVFMFFWGIVVLCTGFVTTWAEMMVLRAIQGALESVISPAFLLLIGAWYRTNEHTLRSIVWGTANAGFGIISSLCMYGIGEAALKHPNGIDAWRGISYFLGGFTIIMSFFTFAILGTPREVWWLSKAEKRMAAARIVGNQTGSDRMKRGEWKWHQVAVAFQDPQTYFFFFTTIVNSIPNGGTTSFGSLVYVSFGFTNLETILKGTVPRNAFSIVWFLSIGLFTRRYPKTRFLCMFIAVVPAFVGMLATALQPGDDAHLWSRWGTYFMTVTGDIAGLMIWTFIPSNVAGRTKKSVTSVILFVAYCVGNSVGSQVFQSKWSPRYVPAILISAIFYGLEMILFLSWRFYYIYVNHQRDKAAFAKGLSVEEREHLGRLAAEADVTDFENEHFRYDY